ncbi:MAG: hypothetical protein HYX78_05525 [Armatimonadetes bacterium]|nr:hypothetical protein [Armatimonadota bacterium]
MGTINQQWLRIGGRIMDELTMLLNEARSLAEDVLGDIDRASHAATLDDALESVQAALRSAETIRDRLDEALDYAETDTDEANMESSLAYISDALDAGYSVVAYREMHPHLQEMRQNIEQAALHLLPVEEIEVE